MRSVPTLSPCGPWLDLCKCRETGPVKRSPAEMEARHREAVRRAQRSGWPVRTLSEIRAGRVAAARKGKAA